MKMYLFKVKELKEIRSKKADETKITYKMVAVNEDTKEKVTLSSEEPIKLRTGQEVKLQEDKSQKRIGE